MPLDGFQYAQSVKGIVERIAYQMGDAEPGSEYEGLDESWIRARVFDTFKWLQGRRPDLFVSEESFSLRTGERQVIPEQCDGLIEILSVNITGKEYPVQTAEYEAIRAGQAYQKLQPTCDWCVFHAAVDERNPERFLFTPSIPQEATVTALCSNMQQFFDDPDLEINCEVAKWINTVVEYVLFQAHSIDGASSNAEAEQHRATFFDLAPVKRRDTDS